MWPLTILILTFEICHDVDKTQGDNQSMENLIFLREPIIDEEKRSTLTSRLSTHPFKYAFFGKKFRAQNLLVEHVVNCHLV